MHALVMVMVMVLNSAYLTTSGVAPAPCSARARPCLDVWWGEPFLVQHPLRWPARPGEGAARGRLRYGIMKPPLGGPGARHVWIPMSSAARKTCTAR